MSLRLADRIVLEYLRRDTYNDFRTLLPLWNFADYYFIIQRKDYSHAGYSSSESIIRKIAGRIINLKDDSLNQYLKLLVATQEYDGFPIYPTQNGIRPRRRYRNSLQVEGAVGHTLNWMEDIEMNVKLLSGNLPCKVNIPRMKNIYNEQFGVHLIDKTIHPNGPSYKDFYQMVLDGWRMD